MARTAQVIDRFESRGKLVLTLWDLAKSRRFTIRVRREVAVDIGELLDLREEIPKLRRIYSDAIESRWREMVILPIVSRPRPVADWDEADMKDGRERGYGTNAA